MGHLHERRQVMLGNLWGDRPTSWGSGGCAVLGGKVDKGLCKGVESDALYVEVRRRDTEKLCVCLA
jgi:hypothetical protein